MSTAAQAALLLSIFIICTGFTIGLTWAPCYASLCTEEFFPAATRYHVATYYGLIASIAIGLFLRAYSPLCYRISTTYLGRREIPVFKKRFSIGGLFLVFWILAIALVTTVFWINPEVNFYTARTDVVDWSGPKVDLVVTAIIGHHVDILLGLTLIPVGRNSLLVRVFGLSYGTLLYTHKLLAYVTIVGVAAHAIAYFNFWAAWAAEPYGSPRRAAVDVNNPTLSIAETNARGPWSKAVLGTGLASFLAMIIVLITALPVIRRRAYNIFYYAHIVFGVVIMVGACCHASTNFYFLLPGVLLWVIDWSWRLFNGDSGLAKEVTATISSASGGWCRIAIPSTPHLSHNESGSDSEAELEKLPAVQPLQTYYISIPSISKLENHAFTAAKVASNGSDTVLLFQKTPTSAIKRNDKAQNREWTWKLSRMIEEVMPKTRRHEIKVRVEGPYMPVTKGYETADKVVCVVGGTGLTGAYSLARWWYQHRSSEPTAHFTLIWTARARGSFDLEEWTELIEMCASSPNMSLQAHCTAESGRLDISTELRKIFARDAEKEANIEASAWVYASGPSGLLTAASDACVDLEAELRVSKKAGSDSVLAISALSHYTADWEV
ncbi:hypothetical protein LTR86_000240 [Recurvomyces mirabilis]|nr:hypothetical protein LTR86_000240 [Recurvomyces mirabilis]